MQSSSIPRSFAGTVRSPISICLDWPRRWAGISRPSTARFRSARSSEPPGTPSRLSPRRALSTVARAPAGMPVPRTDDRQSPMSPAHLQIVTTGTPLDNGLVMLRDLRHGVRVLMQARGWTAVVVLSLAVGIGANTAIFSAVNGMLLRKLSVARPGFARAPADRGTQRHGDRCERLRVHGREPARRRCGRRSHIRCTSTSAKRTRRWSIWRDRSLSGCMTVMVDGRAETVSGLLVTRKLLFDARRERAGRPHHRAER